MESNEINRDQEGSIGINRDANNNNTTTSSNTNSLLILLLIIILVTLIIIILVLLIIIPPRILPLLLPMQRSMRKSRGKRWMFEENE
jgi:hypothetical protein